MLAQEIQAVTEAFLSKLIQCPYSRTALCEVPHLIRQQFKPYSQAAALMLQEKQNSDLASALPKLPSLHHGKK